MEVSKIDYPYEYIHAECGEPSFFIKDIDPLDAPRPDHVIGINGQHVSGSDEIRCFSCGARVNINWCSVKRRGE